jgi:hypothetical protein
MRESKTESISRIEKLVDSVHESARAMVASGNPMHEKVERFEFELRTELKRLGAGEVDIPDDTPAGDLKGTIEFALENYRQALKTRLSAHTRAMLTRQSHEFMELNRAA